MLEDEHPQLIRESVFLQMLQEVGFQAGQHEVLAEAFSKDISKQLHDSAKQLKEVRRKNMKESEKIINDLNAAKKSMQASKEKFRKAFEDQEKANAVYMKANADGTVPRNEVEKLRLSASTKTSVCDTLKHNYADQLVKTNAFRQSYYYELLPGVLDELQALEQRRIELIRHGILSCVAKEREVCLLYYFDRSKNGDQLIFALKGNIKIEKFEFQQRLSLADKRQRKTIIGHKTKGCFS